MLKPATPTSIVRLLLARACHADASACHIDTWPRMAAGQPCKCCPTDALTPRHIHPPPSGSGEFWSLCPPSTGVSIGCEVPSFSPTGSAQTVPAGTCVLSYDGTKNQMAYVVM